MNKLESEPKDEQVERAVKYLRFGQRFPAWGRSHDDPLEAVAVLLESQALTIKRLEHEISARKV